MPVLCMRRNWERKKQKKTDKQALEVHVFFTLQGSLLRVQGTLGVSLELLLAEATI